MGTGCQADLGGSAWRLNRRPFNHGCLGLDGRPQHRCRRHALAVSRRAWTLQQDGDVPGAVCQGRHMLHCWAVTRSVTILESRAVLVVPWCSARALVPHVLPPRDELFVAFQKPLAASTDQPSAGPRQVKLRYSIFFFLNLATVSCIGPRRIGPPCGAATGRQRAHLCAGATVRRR